MDPFESIKQTFFQECDELLTDAEQGLLAMETGEADDETINAVFRAVHSVKGGAGAFGLENLIRFAHVFETVMDELRSGKMELTDEVAKTLLRAFDVLADHVAAARDGGAVDEARSAGMLAELKALIGDHEPPYAAQWRALGEAFAHKMMAGIVAFELHVTGLQCKLKLNQHRKESHAALHAAYRQGGPDAQALAQWMETLGMVPAQEE